MPGVTRVGDLQTGHDMCPPVPLAEGCQTVFVNGRPAGVRLNKYIEHGCKYHDPHAGFIMKGSLTVKAEGRQLARVWDPVSCMGFIVFVAQGSMNVLAGSGVGWGADIGDCCAQSSQVSQARIHNIEVKDQQTPAEE